MSSPDARGSTAHRTFLVGWLAVVLSGVAYAAAFPPLDLGWLAWVALVPLFAMAADRPPREAFRLGYAWGLVAFGGVLWWLTAFGPAVWVLAAALLAVCPAAALGAAAWAERERGGALGVLWAPVLWTAVEFLRSQGPLGFPWALAGESQHRALAIAQIASVTGVWGVGFLVVLVNVVLGRALRRRAGAAAIVVAAAALAAAGLWGSTALGAPAASQGASRAFTAAVVQPAYSTRARRGVPDVAGDIAVLQVLTREAARRAQLVVWPETAFPTDVAGDPRARAIIAAWVREHRVALIASNLEGGVTDSAFAFSPDGLLVGRYDKMRLVPFAEFGERPGRAPGVLPTPQGNVGIAICFESIFPEIARETVRRGADVLAVLTNDAWFAGPAAAEQHAAIAAFRAIEEGRYLLRAANSGVSEIIDPHGRVLARLPVGVRGILIAPVAARSTLTPYARYGDVVPWALVLASAVLLAPRAFARLGGRSDAELVRVIAVSAIPLLALEAVAWGGRALGVSHISVAGVPVSLAVLAALAATLAVSVGRPARALGFGVAGFVPAALAALAVVGVLTTVASRAYLAQGEVAALVPPPGGWWAGGAAQVLVVGVTFEWWLRGAVYEAVSAWRGWRTAVVWSALLGTIAATPRGAEAMVWSLCAGLAFGVIRTRWAQVPALALADGVGSVALGFVLSPW